MSLKHALLGFLNYGPHTGYELKKVFEILKLTKVFTFRATEEEALGVFGHTATG